MPLETLLSLIGLAIAAAFTPGPNNTLVATSGARFGLRATLPHISGVGIGFPVMIFIIAMGLGQVFQQSTLLREAVRLLGMLILLWLAWKIATSRGAFGESQNARPFSFIQSAAFQWINPKAWVMAVGVTAQFVSAQAPVRSAIIVALVFVVAGFCSATTWTLFGVGMQRWLNTANRLRVFNLAMAGLIVLSVLGIAAAEL